MFLKRGTNLETDLAEAMNTHMFAGPGIMVPLNNPEEESYVSNATSNAISIPSSRSKYLDSVSDLNMLPPAHPHVYRESSSTDCWMDLLDHPPHTGITSPSRSLLLKSSLDSYFSLPFSLADSLFCEEIVRTLFTVPEGQ